MESKSREVDLTLEEKLDELVEEMDLEEIDVFSMLPKF